MTTTDGIWISDDAVAEGDMTGPWSANVVLSDPLVDVAVLETARGGIMKYGLGFDWCDVGVMTNVQLDHVGQDGIESLDDIVRVKRLIAERVREGGMLVLNADDEQVRAVAVHPRVTAVPKQIVYFSLNASEPTIEYHRERGGTAVVLNNGWIELHRGVAVARIVNVQSVPSTIGGTVTFQIANALAAAAAMTAAGLAVETVRRALESFDLSSHNAGRLNVFAVRDAYVVVDYGHNPHAIQALCETTARWSRARVMAVLGVPGDRADELIRASARAAAGVDRVIVREDDDTRGRRRGEVSAMLRDAIAEANPALPVTVVMNELESIDAAVAELMPGDIALAFVDDIAGVVQRLREHGAVPAPPASLVKPERAAVSPSAA